MPHLHSKMDTISGMMEVGIKDLQLTVDQNMSSFRKDMEPILQNLGTVHSRQAKDQKIVATALSLMASSLKLFSEGTFETRFRPNDGLTTQLDPALSPSMAQATAGALTFEQSLSQVTQTTHALLNQAQPPPSSKSGLNPIQPAAATSGSRTAGTAGEKTFVLETNHTTVGQLWKEWNIGVSGRASVLMMIEGKYAKSEKQRKLYSRRKLVMDEVKRLADVRTEPDTDIVKSMDTYLLRHGLSMTKL
ncbi:hypothetical protein QFC22_004035 [Naganishia vaughanmartiniae]|uniref:Uncharacterized protein n=1 Tax=Naganishia vaughanmartiniae TaxID=1424756 RepID=A0ACC2X272_9TREE|nr:hypothetical protein QFC22_004035 [Naganishia vaughanmartiniae]